MVIGIIVILISTGMNYLAQWVLDSYSTGLPLWVENIKLFIPISFPVIGAFGFLALLKPTLKKYKLLCIKCGSNLIVKPSSEVRNSCLDCGESIWH